MNYLYLGAYLSCPFGTKMVFDKERYTEKFVCPNCSKNSKPKVLATPFCGQCGSKGETIRESKRGDRHPVVDLPDLLAEFSREKLDFRVFEDWNKVYCQKFNPVTWADKCDIYIPENSHEGKFRRPVKIDYDKVYPHFNVELTPEQVAKEYIDFEMAFKKEIDAFKNCYLEGVQIKWGLLISNR